MSQRAGDPSTLAFNEVLYQTYVHGIQEDFATNGLLVSLYGVLVVLSLLSVYLLVTRSTKKTQSTTTVLSLIIFILLTSTTICTVTWILSCQRDFMVSLIESGAILWSGSNIFGYSLIDPLERVKSYSQTQNCAGTAALTLNIILGDAIVCWRACVVWHRNRAVRVVCGVFLLATFALGVVDTASTCNSPFTLVYESTQTIGLMVGFMYQGFPVGITASILSLTTNLLATLLVGYKAWESRMSLRGYLVAGPRTAQVTKLFALLIESGAIYCAFWVVIVGFQIGQYRLLQTANPDYQEGFFDIVGVIMNGSLVPLIAIYPTIIIVLIALDRSHMERGLLSDVQSLSPPSLPVTLDASLTSHRGNNNSPHSVTEMTVINEPCLRYEVGLGDIRGCTSEERKAEHVV